LVPAERLLIWNVKDGWEPLCRFLGKPIPPIPIPHDNKGGDLDFSRKYFYQSEFGKESAAWFKWNCAIFVCKFVGTASLIVYEYKTGWKSLNMIFEKARNAMTHIF